MYSHPLDHKRLWVLRKDSAIPLYQQIQELIMEHIQAGRLKAGDFLPSYPWLSRTLGVADKTVRQAYAALQQSGVLEIKRGKGTFVASRRELGSTGAPAGGGAPATPGLVGILPPLLPVPEGEASCFWPLLRSLQEALFEAHRDALLFYRPGDLRTLGLAERMAGRTRLEGLILLTEPPEDLAKRLAALKIPTVAAGVPGSGALVDRVVFDHEGAARELTFQLIGQGHRRIGFARSARSLQDDEAEKGYRHAMGSAELPVRPAWVVSVDTELGESGEAALAGLWEENTTALLAARAPLARAGIACAHRKVAAFTRNLAWATLVMAGDRSLPEEEMLAAVFDPVQLGRRAVSRLAELVQGAGPSPRKETLSAQIQAGPATSPSKPLLL